MKRFLLLLASPVALSNSGCCVGFEPGVGPYWNREASSKCARATPGFIAGMTIAAAVDAIDGPETDEERNAEFFGN
jgi:hypothetical protein